MQVWNDYLSQNKDRFIDELLELLVGDLVRPQPEILEADLPLLVKASAGPMRSAAE